MFADSSAAPRHRVAPYPFLVPGTERGRPIADAVSMVRIRKCAWIEGHRLRLRNAVEGDAEFILGLRLDPARPWDFRSILT